MPKNELNYKYPLHQLALRRVLGHDNLHTKDFFVDSMASPAVMCSHSWEPRQGLPNFDALCGKRFKEAWRVAMEMHKQSVGLSIFSLPKQHIIGNSYTTLESIEDDRPSSVPQSCFTDLERNATVKTVSLHIGSGLI